MNYSHGYTTYPREGQYYVRNLVFLFFFFLTAAWIQIIPLIVIESTRNFLRRHLWLFLVSLVIQITAVCLYTIMEPLRTSPLDKLWTLIMVEACVLAALVWCSYFDIGYVGIAIAIGLASGGIAVILGKMCPLQRNIFFYITILRPFMLIIGLITIIPYLATRSFWVFQMATGFIYSAMFMEIILFTKVVCQSGFIGYINHDFGKVSAVMLYYNIMNMIILALPWLQHPYVGRTKK